MLRKSNQYVLLFLLFLIPVSFSFSLSKTTVILNWTNNYKDVIQVYADSSEEVNITKELYKLNHTFKLSSCESCPNITFNQPTGTGNWAFKIYIDDLSSLFKVPDTYTPNETVKVCNKSLCDELNVSVVVPINFTELGLCFNLTDYKNNTELYADLSISDYDYILVGVTNGDENILNEDLIFDTIDEGKMCPIAPPFLYLLSLPYSSGYERIRLVSYSESPLTLFMCIPPLRMYNATTKERVKETEISLNISKDESKSFNVLLENWFDKGIEVRESSIILYRQNFTSSSPSATFKEPIIFNSASKTPLNISLIFSPENASATFNVSIFLSGRKILERNVTGRSVIGNSTLVELLSVFILGEEEQTAPEIEISVQNLTYTEGGFNLTVYQFAPVEKQFTNITSSYVLPPLSNTTVNFTFFSYIFPYPGDYAVLSSIGNDTFGAIFKTDVHASGASLPIFMAERYTAVFDVESRKVVNVTIPFFLVTDGESASVINVTRKTNTLDIISLYIDGTPVNFGEAYAVGCEKPLEVCRHNLTFEVNLTSLSPDEYVEEFNVSDVPIELEVDLTDMFNVEVNYIEPDEVVYGENVTVNINASFVNGTAVPEISKENVSASIISQGKAYSMSVENVTKIKDGVFNITLKLLDENAVGSDSALLNMTISLGSLKGYVEENVQLSAPALTYSMEDAPNSKYETEEKDTIKIKVRNFGTASSDKAKDKIHFTTTVGELEFSKAYPEGCAEESDDYVLLSIDPGEDCTISFTFKAPDEEDEGEIKFEFYGRWIDSDKKEYSVKVKKEEEDSGGGGGGGEGGEKEKEEPKFVKKMSVTLSPTEVKVVQGGFSWFIIRVKNVGNLTLRNLSISFSGYDNVEASNTTYKDLHPDKVWEVKVVVRAGENETIENKTLEIEVKADNLTEKKSVKIIVTPSRKTVQGLLDEVRKYIDEDKVKEIERLINESKYEEAYTLLQEIKKNVSAQVAREKRERSLQQIVPVGGYTNILIVATAIILGIIALLYFLSPEPHGYSHEEGYYRYLPPEERGKPRIKRIVEKIKEKFKRRKREERDWLEEEYDKLRTEIE